MMRVRGRTFQLAVILAMAAMWARGSIAFADGAKLGVSADECSPTDEAKGGLCSHALGEIALFEAGGKPDGVVLEAQDQTDVTHCFFDLEIRTTTNPRSIAATSTMDVTSRASGLTQMTLNLDAAMSVDGVAVNGTAATYSRNGSELVVNLGAGFGNGQTFRIAVTYHGSPKNRADGWTFKFFDTQTNGTDLIAASFNEPFYANYWFCCKENVSNNDDKFTLDMHVTVPNTMTVASNGLLQGVDVVSGNRLKYRWHESYPIATYLVSFAATKYTKITQPYNYPGGSMPVEFYIYPDQVSVSQPYLPTVVEAIETFSNPDLYDQYPFINEKYGIAQFQWCCGMEHQTMTSQGAFTSETRNVHELSHQWWGDNVTCKTWHDIWLNEGFARFSEALFQEKRAGGSYESYLAFLNANRPSSTGTGTVYRYDISNTSAIFSTAYSYNKGGWTMHMLRYVMGDEAFFRALRAYRAAFTGGAADTEDFRAICESVYGADLGWFFNEWVYSTGVPYYRYGWEQISPGNWVRVHLQQYQRTVVSSFPNAMRMPIDITVTTANSTQTHGVWNDATGSGNTVTQWYVFPTDGAVTGLQVDKDTRILRGSLENVAYVNGPPKLIYTYPQIGSSLPAFPTVGAVHLRFSEAVAGTAGDFTVVGSRSGSRSFAFTRDETGTTAYLSFGKALDNGQTWTIQVADTLKSQVASLGLDGEMLAAGDPASLPSGDGIPGGAAILQFTIGAFGPDLDLDNDVDVDDAVRMSDCLGGPGVPPSKVECQQADLDHDGDVDQSDFGLQQRCLSINNVLPDPACAG